MYICLLFVIQIKADIMKADSKSCNREEKKSFIIQHFCVQLSRSFVSQCQWKKVADFPPSKFFSPFFSISTTTDCYCCCWLRLLLLFRLFVSIFFSKLLPVLCSVWLTLNFSANLFGARILRSSYMNIIYIYISITHTSIAQTCGKTPKQWNWKAQVYI